MDNTDKITILDFLNSSVHIYTVPKDTSTETFIQEHGFKESEISWMRSGTLTITIDGNEVKD